MHSAMDALARQMRDDVCEAHETRLEATASVPVLVTSNVSAGTRKAIDLPAPVGSTTTTSWRLRDGRPDAASTSRCLGEIVLAVDVGQQRAAAALAIPPPPHDAHRVAVGAMRASSSCVRGPWRRGRGRRCGRCAGRGGRRVVDT